MNTKQKGIAVLATMWILLWCFACAWFLQWWSILTMTTVGTVGTLVGCVTFVPIVLLGNTLALIAGFRKELGKPRLGMFLYTLAINAILAFTGIRTIIGTVHSLSSRTSLFTPQPKDILWDEWLMLFLIFIAPEVLAMVLAAVGLVVMKRHSRPAEKQAEIAQRPETEGER